MTKWIVIEQRRIGIDRRMNRDRRRAYDRRLRLRDAKVAQLTLPEPDQLASSHFARQLGYHLNEATLNPLALTSHGRRSHVVISSRLWEEITAALAGDR